MLKPTSTPFVTWWFFFCQIPSHSPLANSHIYRIESRPTISHPSIDCPSEHATYLAHKLLLRLDVDALVQRRAVAEVQQDVAVS